jgi:hypothetical protein
VPVIINDLEVVVDAEAPVAPENPERRGSAPLVRPEDIQDIVERQARAMARVLAH